MNSTLWWKAKTALGIAVVAPFLALFGALRGDGFATIRHNVGNLGEMVGHPVHFIRMLV